MTNPSTREILAYASLHLYDIMTSSYIPRSVEGGGIAQSWSSFPLFRNSGWHGMAWHGMALAGGRSGAWWHRWGRFVCDLGVVDSWLNSGDFKTVET